MAKEASPDRRGPEHSLPLSMADQVRLAEARGWETAYEGHRARVFSEVGAFYWTALAPDIVNPGRVEQGSASV